MAKETFTNLLLNMVMISIINVLIGFGLYFILFVYKVDSISIMATCFFISSYFGIYFYRFMILRIYFTEIIDKKAGGIKPNNPR